jgi:hypothetical protein
MLLRIALPVGASALAGVIACGSSSHLNGLAPNEPSDGGDGGFAEGNPVGSIAEPPPDAGDAGLLTGSVHGVVVVAPSDASDEDAATIMTGIAPLNDSGVHGVVVHPEGGSGVLGIVANPGDGG